MGLVIVTSMAEVEWLFDPPPPSGSIQGGTATSYVLDPTLDVFVREVLQNSHDQRSAEHSPARVDIDLIELTGEHKSEFLDAMRFEQLAVHLRGTARESYKLGLQLRLALHDPHARPLRIARIDDYGTVGLTGGEDEKGTNFNSLCRDVLVNTDTTARRGGSYGLGKAVLWRFSSLATVLFVSRVPEMSSRHADGIESETRVRLFGRADLAHHRADGRAWAGPGWLGRPTGDSSARRAESIWDEQAASIASRLGADRAVEDGTGTSVLIVGFAEPGNDQARPLDAIAQDIAAAAERWFWPAMVRTPPTIAVTVGVELDGVVRSRHVVDPMSNSASLVETATTSSLVEHADEPGRVAGRKIEVTVPPARDGSRGSVTGRAELRVRRAVADEEDDGRIGRVALIRGSGMVVEHRRPRRSPTDGGEYHAVLLAGLAHGDDPADEVIEGFLRAAEPPSHNRWVHETDLISTEYKPGSKKALDELWRAIDTALVEIVDPRVPSREPGPSALARLFRLGGGRDRGPSPHSFDVRYVEHHFDGTHWDVSTRVRRLRHLRPWRVDVAVWLDGDSGRGERLPILGVYTDAVADVDLGDERMARVTLDPSVREVTLRIRAGHADGGEQMRRTRLRLDIRPVALETDRAPAISAVETAP